MVRLRVKNPVMEPVGMILSFILDTQYPLNLFDVGARGGGGGMGDYSSDEKCCVKPLVVIFGLL